MVANNSLLSPEGRPVAGILACSSLCRLPVDKRPLEIGKLVVALVLVCVERRHNSITASGSSFRTV
jgi:hypothetical protein